MTNIEHDLDQLATLIREAITTQGAASWNAGRYSAGVGDDDAAAYEKADTLNDAAAAKAVELWTAWYNVAGELGDARRELDKLRGVLARITAAAARVGIELEGVEL